MISSILLTQGILEGLGSIPGGSWLIFEVSAADL